MPDTARTLLPAMGRPPKVSRSTREVGGTAANDVEGGHLLLVLHAPPERDHDKRQGRFFWRQPDGTWSATNSVQASALCSNILMNTIRFLINWRNRKSKRSVQRTTSRSMITLHSITKGFGEPTPSCMMRKQCPDFRELIDVRDRAYTIERTAELLASGCKNGLDFQMAKQAEQLISSHPDGNRLSPAQSTCRFLSTSGDLSGLFGVNAGLGLRITRTRLLHADRNHCVDRHGDRSSAGTWRRSVLR